MNTTTSMGAESFMNYLNELYKKYVESVNKEFCTYFANTLPQKNNRHIFADGVEVDMSIHQNMDYSGGSHTSAQVNITLLRSKKRAGKLLLVEVVDYRAEDEKTVLSELISLPAGFYQFLRNNVCVENKMVVNYLNFVADVKVALGGESHCVFDQSRKLALLTRPVKTTATTYTASQLLETLTYLNGNLAAYSEGEPVLSDLYIENKNSGIRAFWNTRNQHGFTCPQYIEYKPTASVKQFLKEHNFAFGNLDKLTELLHASNCYDELKALFC